MVAHYRHELTRTAAGRQARRWALPHACRVEGRAEYLRAGFPRHHTWPSRRGDVCLKLGVAHKDFETGRRLGW
jgi:hypothetical protein